jgi:hypothetical protein
MRLLQENINDVDYLIETDQSGKKSYYITGPFLQGDVKNKNGRIYPMNVLEKETARYIQEKVNMKSAWGQLNHPQLKKDESPGIDLEKVSHLITELNKDGTNYIGKAKLAETPCGCIARGLMDTGGRLGVSSRGMGSVMEKNGTKYVKEDLRLITAADIVADPSAPDAFVQGLYEEHEWVFENGVWKVQELEEAQKEIERTAKRQLAEKKSEIFQRFLESL